MTGTCPTAAAAATTTASQQKNRRQTNSVSFSLPLYETHYRQKTFFHKTIAKLNKGLEELATASCLDSFDSQTGYNLHLLLLLLLVLLLLLFPTFFHRPPSTSGLLVSWCFEPSQPQRITSRLKTMFNLSPIYSACKLSNHKLSKNHKISPDTNLHKTNIHKHRTQHFRRISPFGITPVKKGT